ncbi:MAG: hypothetical protein H6620_06240 [Halobacteriovoraceae bacterium]|nr:hypothetical protein [Halobacteriovoraceae bacterium]
MKITFTFILLVLSHWSFSHCLDCKVAVCGSIEKLLPTENQIFDEFPENAKLSAVYKLVTLNGAIYENSLPNGRGLFIAPGNTPQVINEYYLSASQLEMIDIANHYQDEVCLLGQFENFHNSIDVQKVVEEKYFSKYYLKDI